jgi:hypothetical protein
MLPLEQTRKFLTFASDTGALASVPGPDLGKGGELDLKSSDPKALAEIAPLRPEVALLDPTGNDCRVFCRQAHLIIPDLRVVASAVGGLDRDVMACVEAGICGYARDP